MIKIIKAFFQILLSVIVTLFLLEAAATFFKFPQGASRFVEIQVLKNKLSTFKPKGETRIFAYGESTLHGSHYWPYSNPALWLDQYLKDFLPGKQIRVVNFARMGQGSDFVYESFRDTVIYKPDFAIFYLGHNTFLPGNRSDQKLAEINQNKSKYFFKQLVRQSRFLSAAVRFGIARRVERKKDKSEDRVGSEEIEAPPSGIGPENQVDRTSALYRDEIENFRLNIKKILDIALKHKVRVIFMKPAGNLKDFPPSCSKHFGRLTESELKEWEGLFKEGQKAQAAGDTSGAIAFYENAASIDADYAELNYRLAHLYLKQGELEQAKKLFESAKENDCIIVRATRETLQIFEELLKNGEAVISTEKILSPEAPGGILGYPIVEDNVHFSPKGHALLGRALAQEMADRDWIAPKSAWNFLSERPFEVISKTLGVTPDLLFNSYLQCVSYFGSKYDSRILFAQKALEIFPDHPKALRHLAWAYWLKGDKENAFKTYQRLKEKYPEEFAVVVQKQPDVGKFLEKSPK